MRGALFSFLSFLSLLAPAAVVAGPREDAAAAERAGDRSAAVAAWRRVVEGEPGAGDAYEALGRQLLRLDRAGEAVSVFEALLARRPDFLRARYRLAFALRKAGRLPAAAQAYRAYAATAPADPDAYFGLAETLRQLGDVEAALVAYRDYVRLERRPAEARWVRRANEHIARLSASEAPALGGEAALEPAPSVPKGVARVKAGRGDPDAAFARGDLRAAQAGYGERVQVDPEDGGARYRLAVTLAALGERAAALEAAAQAVRLDPEEPHAAGLAAGLAAARPAAAPPTVDEVEQALREGRLRTAARFARLASARPGAALGRLSRLRGRALLGLGRSAEALRALKAAAAHGEADPGIWLEMGEAAAQLGDPRARDYFMDQAARLAPPDHPLDRRARRSVAGLSPKGG